MTGNIYQSLLENTKIAMKARDKEQLEALRLISNEIKMHAINNKLELPVEDSVSITIMTKMVKQRKDAIEQFKTASRDDLAVKEEFQLNVLKKFLPKQLSPEETKELVTSTIKELNITTMAELGKLMQVMKQQPAGTVDYALVSKLAKEIIA